jgi:hypothetical protein
MTVWWVFVPWLRAEGGEEIAVERAASRCRGISELALPPCLCTASHQPSLPIVDPRKFVAEVDVAQWDLDVALDGVAFRVLAVYECTYPSFCVEDGAYNGANVGVATTVCLGATNDDAGL